MCMSHNIQENIVIRVARERGEYDFLIGPQGPKSHVTRWGTKWVLSTPRRKINLCARRNRAFTWYTIFREILVNTGKRDYFLRTRHWLDVPGTLKRSLTLSSCPGISLFFYCKEREREKERERGRPSVKGIARRWRFPSRTNKNKLCHP